MTSLDAKIQEKYESGLNRLLQEIDRIKLVELVNQIELHSKYRIDDSWSPSWDLVKQSRLIESLIVNIPVIPIVLCNTVERAHEVIDGKERLKTIVDFYSDRITLTGLTIETELNGCTYSTLPYQVKKRLDNRSLSTIRIFPMNDSNPDEVKKLIETVRERLEGVNR